MTQLGNNSTEAALTTWAAVDIYETENELVLKADLPDVNEKDLDVRVENTVKEDKYLCVERSYGSFSRSFSLPSTVDTEKIHADYKNGVLSVQLPKRAESKPKQVKVNVSSGSQAAK